MSQHKYKEAYNEGYERGKKTAFDGWVQQCYDELTPKEQIELLLKWGADLPSKSWTPVSKELPKEGSHVLVSCRNDSVFSDDYYSYGFDDGGDEVIAWMPLPEPYKESEDT